MESMFHRLTGVFSLSLFVLVSYKLVSRWKAKKHQLPLPPGPPRKFLIGNLLDMPGTHYAWETFTELAKKYGPVTSLSVPGTTIVVLNEYSDAVELLDKKGRIYTDRPYMALPTELLGWKRSLSFLPAGHDFRESRKGLHEGIGTPALLSNYHTLLESLSTEFAERVLRVNSSSMSLKNECFRLAGSISLRIAYGYTVRDEMDEFVSLNVKAVEAASEGSDLRKFWVNSFPILLRIPDWVPGIPFKRFAHSFGDLYPRVINEPFEYVKQQMAKGTAEDCFVSQRLSEGTAIDEELLKNIAALFFSGGTDTSGLMIHVFFWAMLRWPAVQSKLHAEMDSVVLAESSEDDRRLPTFEDRPNLPYLEAVTMELLRFLPPAPCGLPHVSVEDDVHRGYFIPKGSIVFANLIEILRDPKVYSSPDEFRPERFLGPEPELHPINIALGFGRRRCPGRFLAQASIWITIATVVATLDIQPEINGKTGKPIPLRDIRELGSGGIVNTFKEFPCKIVRRSS